MNKLFQQILEPYKPLSGSKEIRQSRGTSEGGESPTCYDFKNRHEETAPAQNTFSSVPTGKVPITTATLGEDQRQMRNTLSGGNKLREPGAPEYPSDLPPSQWPSIAEQEAYWLRKEEGTHN
jgi:hypothetical protein